MDGYNNTIMIVPNCTSNDLTMCDNDDDNDGGDDDDDDDDEQSSYKANFRAVIPPHRLIAALPFPYDLS